MFLINGLQFEAYVKKQHDDFATEKENEKLLRVSSAFHFTLILLENVTGLNAPCWSRGCK